MTNDLVRASGLWLKEGKRGKFMSGHTSEAIPDGAKLLIFKNDRKEPGSTEPDYVLYFVNPDEQPPMRRAEPGQRSQASEDLPDDEIPF
jgi:hypothetical protein